MQKNLKAQNVHLESAAPTESQRRMDPVIDLVHLSAQTLGDHALETELLKLFDNQARQIEARLASVTFSAEDERRAELAHTLKGSAKAIGAFALAAAADEYEQAARRNTPDLSGAWRALAVEIAEARDAIAQLLRPSA